MKEILVLLTSLLTACARLAGRGGARAVIAEDLLLKQQLLIVCRHRKRAPNLSAGERVFPGFGSLFMRPARIARNAITVRPSTLLRCHQYLVGHKYRALFTPKNRGKPGPQGPSGQLIQAIVDFKWKSQCRGMVEVSIAA